MSSSTATYYTVAQLAAIQEERDTAREQSRWRVAEGEYALIVAECAEFSRAYEVTVAVAARPEASGRERAAALSTINDVVERNIASARTELASVRAAEHHRRLLERLRALGGGDPLEPLPARRNDATVGATVAEVPAEPVPARVERYLSALESGVELSARFTEIAESLMTSTTDAGPALRALQAEVARLNQSHRESLALSAQLRELEIRAGSLGPDGAAARAMVSTAQHALDSHTTPDLAAVEQIVAAGEAAADSAARAQYVSEALQKALSSLGFVESVGFETAIPANGRLVTKPGWTHHSLLYNVTGEKYTFDVVRTGREERAELTQAHDVEVESAFCDSDLAPIVDELAHRGINPDRDRRIEPGRKKLEVLPGAEVVIQAPAARAKPQERSL